MPAHPLTTPRRTPAVLAGAAVLVAAATAGCSVGRDAPDADDVIAAATALEDTRRFGQEFVVPPVAGRGTQALVPFRSPAGYRVVLRCLTPGLIEADVSDPEAVRAWDDATGDSVDITGERPCEDQTWQAARRSTGGMVLVTITAPPDTYWVAGIAQDIDPPPGTPTAPAGRG